MDVGRLETGTDHRKAAGERRNSARGLDNVPRFSNDRLGPYGSRLLPVCCPDAPSLTFGTTTRRPLEPRPWRRRRSAASAGRPPARPPRVPHGLGGRGDLLPSICGTRWSQAATIHPTREDVLQDCTKATFGTSFLPRTLVPDHAEALSIYRIEPLLARLAQQRGPNGGQRIRTLRRLWGSVSAGSRA
jgi:hypothetical protein